jgi:hypothetical protein
MLARPPAGVAPALRTRLVLRREYSKPLDERRHLVDALEVEIGIDVTKEVHRRSDTSGRSESSDVWRSHQAHGRVKRSGIRPASEVSSLVAIAQSDRTGRDEVMKIGLSFVALTSATMLALSAGMAQARVGVGEGQATIAKAQAAEAAAMWQRMEATYFNKVKQHHYRHHTTPLYCRLRPDRCAASPLERDHSARRRAAETTAEGPR